MANFSIVPGTQERAEKLPGWYVKRTDPDDHWEIVSPLYQNKGDAQADADKRNAAQPDSNT
jgi:hypothetical protein